MAAPLAWVLVVFALIGPFSLSTRAGPPAHAAAPVTVETPAHTGAGPEMAADSGASMESPGDGTGGAPGVLGLPPKIHLIVNRAGTGITPLAPVLAVLPAPVDRTDAGIRIATDRAGSSPAGEPPANSRWGRAPPRALA